MEVATVAGGTTDDPTSFSTECRQCFCAMACRHRHGDRVGCRRESRVWPPNDCARRSRIHWRRSCVHFRRFWRGGEAISATASDRMCRSSLSPSVSPAIQFVSSKNRRRWRSPPTRGIAASRGGEEMRLHRPSVRRRRRPSRRRTKVVFGCGIAASLWDPLPHPIHSNDEKEEEEGERRR